MIFIVLESGYSFLKIEIERKKEIIINKRNHFLPNVLFFIPTFYSCGVGVHALIGLRWFRLVPFSTFFIVETSAMFKFCRKSYFLSFLKSRLLSIFLLICFIFLFASFIVYSGIYFNWSVLRLFLSKFPLEFALDLCPLCLPSIFGTKSLSTRISKSFVVEFLWKQSKS